MPTVVLLCAGLWLSDPVESAATLTLRLKPGQELVYQGMYSEEGSRPGARFSRVYDLQTFVFILDGKPRETRTAFLTIQRLRGAPDAVPVVRLEQGRIDPHGRVAFEKQANASPYISLQGPPSLEIGAFVETPKDGIDGGKIWQTVEPGDPPMQWSVAGVETVGSRCVKLIGEQKSQHWNRLGEPGWRRVDQVWLQLANGFASRIERTIQHRDASGEVEFRSHMTVDLENSYNPVFHPGGTFRVRQTTIDRACEFSRTLDELLLPGGAPDLRAFENLIRRIDIVLKNVPDTPYREALIALRRRAVLGRSGERAAPPPLPLAKQVASSAKSGRVSPDIILADLMDGSATRLADLLDKPVMLVFVKAPSRTLDHVLAYVLEARKRYDGTMHILTLDVAEDAAACQEALARLKAEIRVYRGDDLHRALEGETTPLFVILDKSANVRFVAPGWGGEYPDWFDRRIRKILHP